MARNQNFQIELSTTLNSSQVDQQIRALQGRLKSSTAIPLTINGTQAIRETNKIITATGEILTQIRDIDAQTGAMIKNTNRISNVSNSIQTVSKDTRQWVDANGALLTTIRSVDSAGRTWITRIREAIDATGTITKTTQNYNGQNRQIGQTLTEVSTQVNNTVTSIDRLNTSIVRQGQSYRAVQETVRTVTNDGRDLSTVTTTYTDNLGRLVTEVQEVDNVTNQVIKTTSTYNSTVQQTGSQANKTTKAVKTLGQSFVETIGKVAKFYFATLPIQALMASINSAKEAIVNFDSAITEYKKVTTLAENEVDKFTDKLGELGKTVARTKTEMVEITTEMTKAGFSDPELASSLAQIVALYQNTADEELSASDASAVLISQMKAFSNQGIEAIHITDAINKVSQDFAVSSGDIGRGLTQAGAALSTYGNSFEQTIGLVTAGKYFLPVTD